MKALKALNRHQWIRFLPKVKKSYFSGRFGLLPQIYNFSQKFDRYRPLRLPNFTALLTPEHTDILVEAVSQELSP